MAYTKWKWCKNHDVVLRALAEKGLSARVMADHFNLEFNTEKTRSAVLGRCYVLNISVGGINSERVRPSSLSNVKSKKAKSFGSGKVDGERLPPKFSFNLPRVDHYKTGETLANAIYLILKNEPKSRQIAPSDIDRTHCKWSTSGLNEAHSFCGHTVVKNRPYCPHHALRGQMLETVKNKALRDIVKAYENGESK